MRMFVCLFARLSHTTNTSDNLWHVRGRHGEFFSLPVEGCCVPAPRPTAAQQPRLAPTGQPTLPWKRERIWNCAMKMTPVEALVCVREYQDSAQTGVANLNLLFDCGFN